MEIHTEPYEDFTVLHLQGDFDAFHCVRFQQEIEGLLIAGVTHVALNLRELHFINSTGLGAIIKVFKTLKREKGMLVVVHPSPFCREIMQKIRLDTLVPVCESDEAAYRALFDGEKMEGRTGTGPFRPGYDETVLLFAPTDRKRVEHFIPDARRLKGINPVHRYRFGSVWCGIGQVTAIEHDGLRFLWGGGKSRLTPFEMGKMLAIGTDLDVKFRLPLLQKGHCRAVVTVTSLEERIDQVKLEVRFKKIDEKAKLAVGQYADDLAFLKKYLTPKSVCA